MAGLHDSEDPVYLPVTLSVTHWKSQVLVRSVGKTRFFCFTHWAVIRGLCFLFLTRTGRLSKAAQTTFFSVAVSGLLSMHPAPTPLVAVGAVFH